MHKMDSNIVIFAHLLQFLTFAYVTDQNGAKLQYIAGMFKVHLCLAKLQTGQLTFAEVYTHPES